MRKTFLIKPFSLFLIFILILIPSLASAQAWQSNSSSSASNSNSWSSGSLNNNQAISFTSSYNGNCNWDVNGIYSSITISGYSGQISLNSNTIIQIYSGWAPTFTSNPNNDWIEQKAIAYINSSYSYHIMINETGRITAIILPFWLTLSNNGTTTNNWYINGTARSMPIAGYVTIIIQAYSINGGGYSYQMYNLFIYNQQQPANTNLTFPQETYLIFMMGIIAFALLIVIMWRRK